MPLFPDTARCSRLRGHSPCPGSAISSFPKEAQVPFKERCAHQRLLGIPVLVLSCHFYARPPLSISTPTLEMRKGRNLATASPQESLVVCGRRPSVAQISSAVASGLDSGPSSCPLGPSLGHGLRPHRPLTDPWGMQRRLAQAAGLADPHLGTKLQSGSLGLFLQQALAPPFRVKRLWTGQDWAQGSWLRGPFH